MRPAGALAARLVLAAGAAVAALYLVELALPAVYRARHADAGASRDDPGFDRRGKLEVVRDLRAQGVEAVPSVHPKVLLEARPDGSLGSPLAGPRGELLPLAGISRRPTVLCNESGEYVVYESDERGFHNPPGLWEGPPPAVALGDSFVHGFCVPSDRNLVARLRERLPGTLNLGMAGDGPLLMLATLVEYAEPLAPPVVLWFFYEGNDLSDLERDRASPLLRGYLDGRSNQRLAARQEEIDGALLALVARRERERPAAVSQEGRGVGEILRLTEVRRFVRRRARRRPPVDHGLFREVLARARDRVAAWGGTLVFVYLPESSRYGGALRWSGEGEAVREAVLATARRLELPVVDVHERFAAHPDPRSLFVGHYSEAGHLLVAETVFEALAGLAAARGQG